MTLITPVIERSEQLERLSPNISARHILGGLLLVPAWIFLSRWYQFQNSTDYRIFAVLMLCSLGLAVVPSFKTHGRSLSYFRWSLLGLLLILALPWGEWFKLNFPTSREAWSLQLLQNIAVFYGIVFFCELMPSVFKSLTAWIQNALVRFSVKWVLCLLPLLFFLLASWMSLNVFQKIPLVQDSAAHLFQASVFANQNWYAPAPPLQEFFEFAGDMLILRDGKWFSMYLPGFSLLLALAKLVHIQWILCPFLGAVSVAVWMLYAYRWHGKEASFLVGLLSVFSPFMFIMFGAVMIHSIELAAGSCLFFLCRRQTEEYKIWRTILIVVIGLIGFISRGFSLIPFLAPLLIYIAFFTVQNRKVALSAELVMAVVASAALVLFFQSKTTGNLFFSGYHLEYSSPLHYGFGWIDLIGETHTPARALENTSNNILGLNLYLTGWYSGALIFLIAAIVFLNKVDTWDVLLICSTMAVALFYFFYGIQDLALGPRFYFPMVPILLLFIARTIAADSVPGYFKVVFLVSFVSFFPARLPEFITKFMPSGNQLVSLKTAIEGMATKTLVFLDKNSNGYLVGWNDPFLQSKAIIARDLGPEKNRSLMREFPEYQPGYFRLKVEFGGRGMSGGYGIYPEPDNSPAGYVSLFAVGMTMQTAREYPQLDFFDLIYSGVFRTREAETQLKYLDSLQLDDAGQPPYRAAFRAALRHAAKMILLPKAAYERNALHWNRELDLQQFRNEFEMAGRLLRGSGAVGVPVLEQMEKVRRRIDMNSNRSMEDDELIRYLAQKVKPLAIQ